MRLATQWSTDDLNKMNYPILVQNWERKLGLSKTAGSMSFKRKFKTIFTEHEIKIIRKYYRIFYNWYLVKGTPIEHEMTIATHQLLNRAIHFFATEN